MPSEVQMPETGGEGVPWWRHRADEIERDVATSGSQDAMHCYTQMRQLLQASTLQDAAQPAD